MVFKLKYHDKNGFGEWLFLDPGRTPEYGMGLMERIWGPVKISGIKGRVGKGKMFFNDFNRFYHLKNNKGRC